MCGPDPDDETGHPACPRQHQDQHRRRTARPGLPAGPGRAARLRPCDGTARATTTRRACSASPAIRTSEASGMRRPNGLPHTSAAPGGEAKAGDVIKAARLDGIAQHTLQRARKRAASPPRKPVSAAAGCGSSTREDDTKVTKATVPRRWNLRHLRCHLRRAKRGLAPCAVTIWWGPAACSVPRARNPAPGGRNDDPR